MRVVRSAGELPELLERARSEARRRSATTRSSSRSWSCGRSTSRCRSSATTTATWCTSSSATARCSGATRRWSSTRRPGRSREALRARLADDALKVARQVELLQRRHGRVPGRRGRRPLLHRGQPAHPGRAHGDRGDHRPRSGAGAAADRRGLPPGRPRDRHRQPGGHRPARRRHPGARHRRGSQERLSPRHRQDPGLPAGGGPRHPPRRRLGLRRARASRPTTTRCWPRSPPAASSGTTPAARWSARCASSASAA